MQFSTVINNNLTGTNFVAIRRTICKSLRIGTNRKLQVLKTFKNVYIFVAMHVFVPMNYRAKVTKIKYN